MAGTIGVRDGIDHFFRSPEKDLYFSLQKNSRYKGGLPRGSDAEAGY